MSVTISGLDSLNQLAVDLGTANRQALPLARLAVQKTCQDIKADASADPDAGGAPRDTGNLSNSIGYETRQLATSVYGEVGPTAEYGEYVENGTARQAPQPYMGPAFTRRAPGLEQALGQVADIIAGRGL